MIRVTPEDKLTSWRASMADLRQLSSRSLTTPASGPITRAIRFSLSCPEVQSEVKNRHKVRHGCLSPCVRQQKSGNVY